MPSKIRTYLANLEWSQLLIGAIIGLLLTSFATPVLNPQVTKMYQSVGVYSSPEVAVDIENTGEFHPNGVPVDDYDDLIWNDNYSVYRIEIRNTGEKSIERLKFTWRSPRGIVYSNTEGPTVDGKYSLSNRGSFGVSSDKPLSINRYQGTKNIEVTNGQLYPGEQISVEFVVKSNLEKCDFLIDLNPRNLHKLTYSWEKNGVQFSEQRVVRPSHLDDEYIDAQNTEFIGTRESLEMSSGDHIHNFVVGVRADNVSEALEKCANTSS